MGFWFRLSIGLLCLGLWGTPAGAGPLVFVPLVPGPLSAEATFDVSGSDLIITLTNDSTIDALGPADALIGLFFDIAGNPALTPTSAFLDPFTGFPALSHVVITPDNVAGPDNGDGNVGGEWNYQSNLTGAPGGAKQGLAAAGFGLGFGIGNLGGPDLEPPLAVDGPMYGILSASDNPSTSDSPSTAYIVDTVKFTLSGLPGGFTLQDISNVSAQFGTGLNEPNILLVPEPSTFALMGIGLAGLGLMTRGRRR